MVFFSHVEPLLQYSDRIVFILLHGEMTLMLLRLEITTTTKKARKQKVKNNCAKFKVAQEAIMALHFFKYQNRFCCVSCTH